MLLQHSAVGTQVQNLTATQHQMVTLGTTETQSKGPCSRIGRGARKDFLEGKTSEPRMGSGEKVRPPQRSQLHVCRVPQVFMQTWNEGVTSSVLSSFTYSVLHPGPVQYWAWGRIKHVWTDAR